MKYGSITHGYHSSLSLSSTNSLQTSPHSTSHQRLSLSILLDYSPIHTTTHHSSIYFTTGSALYRQTPSVTFHQRLPCSTLPDAPPYINPFTNHCKFHSSTSTPQTTSYTQSSQNRLASTKPQTTSTQCPPQDNPLRAFHYL